MSPEELQVGCVLKLTEEQAEDLVTAEKKLVDLHTKLGVLFNEFEETKSRLRKEISQSRIDWEMKVVEVGESLGANMQPGGEQDWEYVPDTRSFVRTK